MRRFPASKKKEQKMNNKNEVTTTTVAKINNVDIVVIENGIKIIPIKPICEALGIDFSSQLQKLKDDPILCLTMGLNTTVGADGKSREMATIPFKYVFGWLFRIDSRNVKEEAREAVLRYQVECYDALYNHFTQHSEFFEWQNMLIEEQLLIVEQRQRLFAESKTILTEAKDELNRRRKLTIADFIAEKSQLKINFEEE